MIANAAEMTPTMTEQYPKGRVIQMVHGKPYGFVLLEEKTLLFHLNQEGRLVDGEFVRYLPYERRRVPQRDDCLVILETGPGSEGRGKVEKWVLADPDEIKTTDRAPTTIAKKPALKPADRPHPAPPVPRVVVPIAESEVPVRTSAPQPLSETEWIEVSVRLRPQGITYARHETLGQFKVPTEVLQRARIKSSKPGDRFEIRATKKEGEDLPVALEIRRY